MPKLIVVVTRFFSLCVLLLALPAIAAARETLTAPFTNGPNGATTTNSYSGSVSIKVSGFGQAAESKYSDAFYIFTDNSGNPITPEHHFDFGLCINIVPVENYLVSTIPPYRKDHTYQFTISIGSSPQQITFGVCDTFTADNSGSFIITVTSECKDASGFSQPLKGKWVETQAFANYLTTFNGQTYNGYHAGEDLAFSGKTAGRDVYAIGAGKIAKISDLRGSGLGHLVAIQHNGSFTIPGKSDTVNGQMYAYNTETVATIYSIYLHVDPRKKLTAGDCVKEGDTIATLTSISAPHLHFEIRHPSQTPDRSWSLVGPSNNWQTFPGTNTRNGYYINVQTMVNGGVRHPSEFLNANP